MNRLDKKRQERELQKLDKVHMITEREWRDRQEAVKNVTTRYVTDIVMAVVINALNAEYGFGHGRLQKVVDEINGQIIAVANGRLSADEVTSLATSFGLKNVFSRGDS